MAVTSSTLTTVCVFLPIIFITGVAGQLFADQSLTVTYSLMASLLVALTLIPMMSSGFKGTAQFGREGLTGRPATENHPFTPSSGQWHTRRGPRWIYAILDRVTFVLRLIFYWIPFGILSVIKYLTQGVG